MSYFAKIENGIVVNVIVAEQEFADKLPGTWAECPPKDVRRGKNKLGQADSKKNFPGKGYQYDGVRFFAPKPELYASWIFDEDEAAWNPPVSAVADDVFWDEGNLRWITKTEVLGE